MEKEVAKEEFNLKFGEVTRIGGQGAVKSVNGQVGDVILTTSDIENTSGYQDKDEVAAAIGHAAETLQGEIDDLSADKQDKLTAGENITIEGNVISATGGETVNVVQSTGDSTEDVMSQKAVTDALGSVGGGSAIELTETDFNYPANNPTAVALWLLPPGVYYTTTLTISTNASASQVLASTSTQLLNQQNMTTFLTLGSYGGAKTIIGANGILPSSLFANSKVFSFLNVDNAGNYQGGSELLQKANVKDNLTSTSTDTPLSANQGKILNDKITALEARVAALEGN